jgi:putative DNA-invertase from lambdoid prophage Rac
MVERIGIYLRVSTQDQSYELQESEIRRYLESRGWGDPILYADKATGTNANRSELKRLLRDARERRLDKIVVWKLDRFARSLKDLILMLQELGELGVEFVSLRDQIDLTTSAGRLLLHVVGAFAQFEADLIKERVRAGLVNAKAKGQKLGRPFQIDASRVAALRRQGLSLSQIAKQVGATKSGVSKTLSKLAVQHPEIVRARSSSKVVDATSVGETLARSSKRQKEST